jgi:hypothetical protein
LARKFGVELLTISTQIDNKLKKFLADEQTKKRAAEAEAARLQRLADQQKAEADRKLREAEDLKQKADASPFSAAIETPPAVVTEKVQEARAAHGTFLQTHAAAQTALAESAAPLAAGAKPRINFRVKNINELHAARPELVDLIERRRDILVVLNRQQTAGLTVGLAGIEVFDDFSISKS